MVDKEVTHVYEQVRQQIRNGDLIFCPKSKTFFSKLVAFVLGSHYTHVAIAFWLNVPPEPRLMIIEAQGGVVRRILPLSEYVKDTFDVVRVTNVNWNHMATYAFERAGLVQYGYLDAFYLTIKTYAWKWFGIKMKSRDFSGEICSEFVANCMAVKPSDVTPQDLFDALSSVGNGKVVFKVRS